MCCCSLASCTTRQQKRRISSRRRLLPCSEDHQIKKHIDVFVMSKVVAVLFLTHHLQMFRCNDIDISKIFPMCYGFVVPVLKYQTLHQQHINERSPSSLTMRRLTNPLMGMPALPVAQSYSVSSKARKESFLLSATLPKSSSQPEHDASTTIATTAKTVVDNSTVAEMTMDTTAMLKSAFVELDDVNTVSTNDEHMNFVHSVQSYIEQNVFMGIPLTFELIAIITIYFVEGALGIARLAQSYLFKDTLHLGPAELSALSGLFVLPWTLKPLYGFLSDGIPLFGYKRKSYLILCGVIGTIAYGILGYEPLWDHLSLATSTQGTVVALMVGSACIAFSDVVADGIVVTRTREIANRELQMRSLGDDDSHNLLDESNSAKTAGGLQSLCWGASAIGGLLSAYFSGSLLEVMSVRSIFGLTAILPFLVAIISTGIDEERQNLQSRTIGATPTAFIDGVRDQISTLWQAFQQSSIWKPTLFVFLWQSTPTSDGAFFYFLTNDLHLGPEFLGRVRFITAGAGLLGVFLYNQYFKTMQIKNILFWSTLLSFPLGLLPVLLITHANRELGIPDTWLIYGDDVALAVLGTIAFMPTLVLAARLCPPGIEAVLFATLMSIYNGASTVGTELGALLTKVAGITESNFDNLALLTIFCNVSSLWPLVLIGWLDEVGTLSEADIEASND